MSNDNSSNDAATKRMQPCRDTLGTHGMIEEGCGERPADKHIDTAAILRAIRFAAYKHRKQQRKDACGTPYIAHPIRVAEILADVAGIGHEEPLIAAVLHDTIEDTDTTLDEIEKHFGQNVRHWVMEVTDDKSLDKQERKQRQIDKARSLSEPAKQIKLADKIANITDIIESPPSDWSIERKRDYLDWSEKVIDGCRGICPPLEELFDERVAEARALLTNT